MMQWFGTFVFRYRDYLAPLVLLGVLLFTRPQPFLQSENLDRWLDALGIVVALVGQSVRVVVIGYAYIVRGGVKKQVAAPRLVSEGLYAHSRNPMYLGNFLLILGLALIYNSGWVYGLVLPLVYFGLLSIVRAEETFLAGKFGEEYREYCRRVNRFLPNPRGLRARLAGMRFDWKRVLRKEYGTTFAWTSTALAFLCLENVSWHGLRGAGPFLRSGAIIWTAIFLLYLTVRWMKKTRRLHPAGG